MTKSHWLFPFESAIYRSLPPAAYTAIVRGKEGGVGVVEVYNSR